VSDAGKVPGGAPRLERLRRWLGGAALAVGIALLGVVSFALVQVTNGNPLAAAAPILVVALLWAMSASPLRWSAVALIFLLLAIDDENTALGLWHTPWAMVNEILVLNVDHVFPAAHGFKLNGMELVALILLVIGARRRLKGDRIDDRGQGQTASVVVAFLLIYLGGIVFAVVNGVLRGGSKDFIIVQARPYVHLLLLFFLFNAAFRGSRDLATVGKVVLAAGLAKAMLAIYVAHKFSYLPTKLACATSHGDSFLFTMGSLVLITNFLERPDRRRLLNCALFLPVLFLGMQDNGRRLVWVQLGLALIAIYLVSPWRRWKLTLTRVAAVVAPIALLYVALGWNSGSSVFGPVHVLRSVSDSKSDRSTYFRHVEDYNLAMGMQYWPVTGRGFGHEFVEYLPEDDITLFFPEYHAQPHNQVLGLLFFGGLVTFTAVWLLLSLGVFLAVRIYRRAVLPLDRAAALCCYAAILVNFVDAYGDLGPYNIQNKVLTALALAVVAKMAVTVGAWPARVQSPVRAPVPGGVLVPLGASPRSPGPAGL
jgi:hypothetical protein